MEAEDELILDKLCEISPISVEIIDIDGVHAREIIWSWKKAVIKRDSVVYEINRRTY